METKKIIYASAIEVLAFIQLALPMFLMMGTSAVTFLTGAVIMGIIVLFWTSTKAGKWFLRELYRSSLRLEKLLEP